jgi:hypothetical protein
MYFFSFLTDYGHFLNLTLCFLFELALLVGASQTVSPELSPLHHFSFLIVHTFLMLFCTTLHCFHKYHGLTMVFI